MPRAARVPAAAKSSSRVIDRSTRELKNAYLAQFADDGDLDLYVEAWDRVVAAHGHAKALEIFWSIMDALDEEQRSDFDPDGNARVGS